MEYRRLGRSGLMVSALSLGGMTWGGEGLFAAIGSVGVEDAARQVDMAIDAGVNLIDTADVYSFGRSEEIFGEILKGRRNRLVVATKGFAPTGPDIHDRGSSRRHIVDACEASLRRLSIDTIDLYQLHGWDGLVPVEETLRALDELVRAGKIRYVGVSNFAGWQFTKTIYEAKLARWIEPVAHQIHYSLLCRDAEHELLPAACDLGVGTMIWSPLASGLLSGKYRRDAPEPAGTRIDNWGIPPRPDTEKLHAVVDVLIDIASAKRVSPAQVALAWLLTRPTVSTLIVGARNEAQLADNLGAADVALARADLDRLECASRPALPYPLWQQHAISSDRLSPADMIAIGDHLKAARPLLGSTEAGAPEASINRAPIKD